MSQHVTVRGVAVLATLWLGVPARSAAQQRDTIPRPSDSLKVYTLPPAVVSVTRANPPINRIPQAVELVDRTEINRARPTWGLDEALATVPGVYAANRYNFSLDQRISIRGFGAGAAASSPCRGSPTRASASTPTPICAVSIPGGTSRSPPAGRSPPWPTWGGTRGPTTRAR